MMSNKMTRRIFIFAVVIFFLACNGAHAATLQISSDSATLSPGSITMLSVVLNSEGVAINNAEAKIIFPTDLLEVVSINKNSSIFSLWVEEPAYSNSTGIITFNGGIPTPGFIGQNGTVISVVFKAKATGKADLIFSDAAVRANDGLGTDVLSSKLGKSLIVVKKEQSIPVYPTAESSADLALQITSPTHTNQDYWYKDRDPIFRWNIPEGADAIQTSIDNDTKGVPRITYVPGIKEKSVKDLEDGIWYFKARARVGGEWGPISTYVARIDSTIPKKNSVTFFYDDSKKILDIKTDIIDETSGMDHYEIYINDSLIKKVPAIDFTNGNYNLIVHTSGDNSIKLVAVDRAGNSVESLGTFQATAIPEEIQPTTPEDRQLLVTIGSFSAPIVYVVTVILLISLLLVIGAFKIGRHYSKVRNRLKVRTALTKGDNTKVLLSLKKRLEKHLEILQHTRHNRVLSKEEKDIKEAIEVDLDEVDRAIEEQNI